MAGRGRGRGGRGPAVVPFTDEETGKRVTLDVDAPPPLFPVLASASQLKSHPSFFVAQLRARHITVFLHFILLNVH